VSNGFARHPWPTRPRTGSTTDSPGSRPDRPAMLVQETLKKGRVLETATPYLPPRPAKLIGRIDRHRIHAGRRGRAIAAGTGQTQSSAIEARDRGADPDRANIRPLTRAGARAEFAIDRAHEATQADDQKPRRAGPNTGSYAPSEGARRIDLCGGRFHIGFAWPAVQAASLTPSVYREYP
jgi:hypothetical protein